MPLGINPKPIPCIQVLVSGSVCIGTKLRQDILFCLFVLVVLGHFFVWVVLNSGLALAKQAL
jgi:hypothetical protein